MHETEECCAMKVIRIDCSGFGAGRKEMRVECSRTWSSVRYLLYLALIYAFTGDETCNRHSDCKIETRAMIHYKAQPTLDQTSSTQLRPNAPTTVKKFYEMWRYNQLLPNLKRRSCQSSLTTHYKYDSEMIIESATADVLSYTSDLCCLLNRTAGVII